MEAFNAFFKNKYSVEEEEDGVIAGDSEWMPRTFGSMHRKLRWGGGSKVGEERKKLGKLVGNRRNERIYVPELSVEEVAAYQKDETIVLDGCA